MTKYTIAERQALKVACWVCEKIPATSIYAAAIRKFVPFL